jgi:hypothetical protein
MECVEKPIILGKCLVGLQKLSLYNKLYSFEIKFSDDLETDRDGAGNPMDHDISGGDPQLRECGFGEDP